MNASAMRLSFANLPFVAQLAIGVVALQSWIMFAEVVIDRHGLAPHLPFYRYGNLCVWDLTVVALIAAGVIYGRRRG